jgi:septum formation inhibitor MinC
MDTANAVSNDNEDLRPPALLRGTAKGLEIHLVGSAGADAIVTAVTRRLEEAPGFFRGSDVRIRVEEGPLPAGCLGRLDELAVRFELRIVEVGAPKRERSSTNADADAVPRPNLAAGSAPSPAVAEAIAAEPVVAEPVAAPVAAEAIAAEAFEAFEEAPTGLSDNPLLTLPPALPGEATVIAEPVMLAASELTELVEVLTTEPPLSFDEPTQTAVPIALATTALEQVAAPETTNGTRLVVGPVRSGVILEHQGHLIVFGDVNPGAEIRAVGNIVVLGRLRGTAHAGIGQDVGFILALRLEPQQLRVGRKVARAADSDTPASEAELAYCTGDQIVVERYSGKLPRNLATSI